MSTTVSYGARGRQRGSIEAMELRRIAILGDIHAEDRRLEAALAYARDRGVDAALSVGDIMDGRGDAARCIELLTSHGVHCVRGNHDRWWTTQGTPRDVLSDEAVRWLAALPPTRAFESALGPILLCHGLAENDMVGVEPGDEGYALEANTDLQALIDRADFRIVINGHTHSRMVRRMARKLWIVNAGTLKGEDEPGFGILDFEMRRVEWLQFSADDAPVPVGGSQLD
jgi:predicted phosphodiesterase